MKKALRKNFYMEIRHSLGRFLSIFFIVAIGCAFFSGIRASEPDMRYSGDAYFDEMNLMDIQVMSTMGLTEDDLDALVDIVESEEVELTFAKYNTAKPVFVECEMPEGDRQAITDVLNAYYLYLNASEKVRAKALADISYTEVES